MIGHGEQCVAGPARIAVRSGERVEVMFAAPMHAAAGERFWITIA
jgi:hypothetical protein